MKIDSFRDADAWLSNFFKCPVIVDGITYPSAENAYQAHKFSETEERIKISLMSPKESKNYPKNKAIRPDWDDVRLNVMYNIVYAKFSQNPALKNMLVNTSGIELIEGNTWGDTFWGVYKGKGENHLGKILMRVRDELSD